MMYAPMKNLSKPLPSANFPAFSTTIENYSIQQPLLINEMPRPHPLRSLSSPNGYRTGENELRGGWKDLEIVERDALGSHRQTKTFARDDDQESIIR